MRESRFQSALIRELRERFDGCIVMKTDANYIQGFPDLLILFNGQWAALEVKADRDSPRQPNQEYYVEVLGAMSFAAFICPQNKEEVLRDLQQTFRPRRQTRVSQRK